MWVLLLPLSVVIFFAAGRTRLGYVGAWMLAGVVNALLTLAAYFMLSNSIALTPDALVVTAASFFLAFAGPIAFWLHRFLQARRKRR
jgi:hypothetical protein